MPANLTPDYLAAEKRYRAVRDPAEKLELLREMLRLIPKHKGTEKLQAGLKQKIAKFQSLTQRGKRGGRTEAYDHVEKEGAGQVALVGLPNSGKSSIVVAATNARPEVADYPFSTFKPLPGMMPFEDIQIQLVDLPPISSEYTEPWVFGIIRTTDLAALTVDLSQPTPVVSVTNALAILEEHHLVLAHRAEQEKPGSSVATNKALILGTKCDVPDAENRFEELQETYGEEYPMLPVSVTTGKHLEAMKRAMFDALDVVRVYTRQPHQRKADLGAPYILPRGSTVADAARAIHKDMLDKMKFARIWGSERFDGQPVQRDHVVEDRDIIEIHL